MIKKSFFSAQLIRFGLVGTCAAIVNYLVVIGLVELLKLHPLIANIFAFFAAFNVSFIGHRYWTFHDCLGEKKLKFNQFFLIALSSFFANETLFFFFLHYAQLSYPISLLIVLIIVPPLTFITSKIWGCRKRTLPI